MALDSKKFPPLIPTGRYRVETVSYADNIEAIKMHIYIAVTYPKSYNGPH